MNEEMITGEEGIELYSEAGLSENTFYRHARERRIKKTLPDDKERGALYSLEDIKKIVEEKHSKRKNRSGKEEKDLSGETDWIKSSDMGYMYNLEYSVYGDETGNPSIIRKWYERNPYICRVLYNKTDRRDFWGAINMLPLEEEAIFKLLKGEIHDIELDPQKDILTFEKPGAYDFYVASVIVHPDKKQYFPMLINSLFDFWCEQAPTRTIRKIYGRVVTDDGEMMARKLFFSPLWNISENAYVLDINRPNPSRIVQGFQHCIKSRN